MSALPRITPADLLAEAVEVDWACRVIGVDCALVLQALELATALGQDRTALLESQQWYRSPQILLSLAVDGEALDSERRLHAVWAVRQIRHLWPAEQRHTLRAALLTAWRYARGEATRAELVAVADAAYAAADAAAYAAVGYAGADATYSACFATYSACYATYGGAADAAYAAADPAAARAAQQRRLIKRTLTLLDRETP